MELWGSLKGDIWLYRVVKGYIGFRVSKKQAHFLGVPRMRVRLQWGPYCGGLQYGDRRVSNCLKGILLRRFMQSGHIFPVAIPVAPITYSLVVSIL